MKVFSITLSITKQDYYFSPDITFSVACQEPLFQEAQASIVLQVTIVKGVVMTLYRLKDQGEPGK